MKTISNFCDNCSIFTWFAAETNIKIDRQTLNCLMATLLTMVPPEKKNLSNKKKKKNMKIRSKIIDEQTLKKDKKINIQMIRTNFLLFEVG